jgi:hypothetical protein
MMLPLHFCCNSRRRLLLPGLALPRIFSNKGDVGVAGEIARGMPITIPRMHDGVSSAAACPHSELTNSRQSNPTGKSVICLSSPFRKNIPVHFRPKSLLYPPLSRAHERGVSRSSRTLGAGCGGRDGGRRDFDRADECRFRGRRSRVVLTPRRWRQVGGSDSAGDGGKKAGHRGEHVISRKTIAQGRPDCLR